MTKRDLIFAISKACPEINEPFELLKRLDQYGEFSGSCKSINDERFAKLCRDALQEGDFPDDIKAELSTYETSIYTWGGYRPGAGRPSTGRRKRTLYITDEEYDKLTEHIETLRKE